MICHQVPTFSGHRYCSSRAKNFLVSHVVNQHHVTINPGDYTNRAPQDKSPSCQVCTVVVEIAL